MKNCLNFIEYAMCIRNRYSINNIESLYVCLVLQHHKPTVYFENERKNNNGTIRPMQHKEKSRIFYDKRLVKNCKIRKKIRIKNKHEKKIV